MRTKLRLKCKNCGHWNRFEVDKFVFEQLGSNLDVGNHVAIYKPLKEEKCKKCTSVIAESKKIIRITRAKTNKPKEGS